MVVCGPLLKLANGEGLLPCSLHFSICLKTVVKRNLTWGRKRKKKRRKISWIFYKESKPLQGARHFPLRQRPRCHQAEKHMTSDPGSDLESHCSELDNPLRGSWLSWLSERAAVSLESGRGGEDRGRGPAVGTDLSSLARAYL